MDHELNELRLYKYEASRIPPLDALEIFVPTNAPADPELDELIGTTLSRWYTVDGGHRVLVLYQGGSFNAERFTLRKGAWDHEHCKRCQARIAPMTPCWVSVEGPVVILCETCHADALQSSG